MFVSPEMDAGAAWHTMWLHRGSKIVVPVASVPQGSSNAAMRVLTAAPAGLSGLFILPHPWPFLLVCDACETCLLHRADGIISCVILNLLFSALNNILEIFLHECLWGHLILFRFYYVEWRFYNAFYHFTVNGLFDCFYFFPPITNNTKLKNASLGV